jgi:hypothetical protein
MGTVVRRIVRHTAYLVHVHHGIRQSSLPPALLAADLLITQTEADIGRQIDRYCSMLTIPAFARCFIVRKGKVLRRRPTQGLLHCTRSIPHINLFTVYSFLSAFHRRR